MTSNMRSLLTLTVGLLSLSPGLSGQNPDEPVDWLDNYEAAIAEAKRTQKPIFLEFRCEA